MNNIIEFIDWIGSLEKYLESRIIEDDVDSALEIGQVLGYLLAGKGLITQTLLQQGKEDSFWDDFAEWKRGQHDKS